MNKVQNNKAWWLVLPVFLLVAFSAVIPMMTVVNYSVPVSYTHLTLPTSDLV